jgi:hypothetical protein
MDRIHSTITISSKLDGIAQNHNAAPPTVMSLTPSSHLLAFTLYVATSFAPAFRLRCCSRPCAAVAHQSTPESLGAGGSARSEFEMAMRDVRNCGAVVEQGGFVLYQMSLDMWYVKLTVDGNKVKAGCNNRLVWRHTAWLDTHATKGLVWPLRRCSRAAASLRRRNVRCPISCSNPSSRAPRTRMW